MIFKNSINTFCATVFSAYWKSKRCDLYSVKVFLKTKYFGTDKRNLALYLLKEKMNEFYKVNKKFGRKYIHFKTINTKKK